MKNVIDKYSIWIGAGLILLSLIGGTLLMVKKGKASYPPEPNPINDEKDAKIFDLEKQVSDLTKENSNLKNQVSQKPAVTSQPSSTASQSTGKININSASSSQLDSLPGIGPTYAQRIIDYRNQNGGFKKIEEIKNVKGIGDKTYAKFKDQITI